MLAAATLGPASGALAEHQQPLLSVLQPAVVNAINRKFGSIATSHPWSVRATVMHGVSSMLQSAAAVAAAYIVA